ncbi:unnamed protein product [Nippostrongylus brasiliensis]|uniref:Uncharacterized protein n=1 Tax=Nippostrongylus brasiliensis TaxID=27835 RepID=A0A0N4Y8K3_NIPBR|nr:unnamed protein product [Nippostrongylus brasiliensis]
MSDILQIGIFEVVSPEVRQQRREDKAAKDRRRRDEHRPNIFVMPDPDRRRHKMNISFAEPRPHVTGEEVSDRPPKKRRMHEDHRDRTRSRSRPRNTATTSGRALMDATPD